MARGNSSHGGGWGAHTCWWDEQERKGGLPRKIKTEVRYFWVGVRAEGEGIHSGKGKQEEGSFYWDFQFFFSDWHGWTRLHVSIALFWLPFIFSYSFVVNGLIHVWAQGSDWWSYISLFSVCSIGFSICW